MQGGRSNFVSMIAIILRGRLGNWLFQYAAGRALANRRGTRLQLNLCERRRLFDWRARWAVRQLKRFQLQADLSVQKVERSPCLYREPDLAWHAEVSSLPDGTCLDGYFQSEQYFKEIEAQIRRDLTISAPRDAATAAVERRMAACTAVSVHVRRTDFLRLGRDLLGPPYYDRAMARVREQWSGVRFFIFSDAPTWCGQHFQATDCEVVDLTLSRRDPVNDLRLLSLCRHHVIANSTYSWWGAWLGTAADKTVFAPTVWLPDTKDNADITRSGVPAEWIRIPCGAE